MRFVLDGKGYGDVLAYTDQILLYDGLGLSDREIELLHSFWNKMRDRRMLRKQSF